MNDQHPNPTASRWLLPIAMASVLAGATEAAELSGFALMPANTFADGPTSGQFAGPGAGGNALPLINAQPVQGISAVLKSPRAGLFYVMPDNGFGTKGNSADALLRMYAVKPDFRSWNGKSIVGGGTIKPADFRTGQALGRFDSRSFINLRDPRGVVGFSTVAEQTFYPNGAGNVPVAAEIKAGRLLTGADFDIESVRRDRSGNFWFGDEFGPFLLKTDSYGRVLQREIATPNIVPPGSTAAGVAVRSPQNPFLDGGISNLGASRGFEGMAITPAGDKLYTLLEGTVTGDDAIDGSLGKNLRINEFDIRSNRYTERNWLYRLEPEGTNIGDMTAINDHEFLVIERNGATATAGGTPFKKIFIADTQGVAKGTFVRKRELVNLMNLADPHDLNADGSAQFTFPFVTIESVLILSPRKLLVINDNNYPGTGGRDQDSDNSEFIVINLDERLQVAPPLLDGKDDDRGRRIDRVNFGA